MQTKLLLKLIGSLFIIFAGMFMYLEVSMSSLDVALVTVLKHEGGWCNTPGDTGGETYVGISRKNWPKWEGWKDVDAAKPLKNEEIIANPELHQKVVKFYKDNFWEAIQLNKIESQKVATKVMDMAVNMGSYRAITLLQEALDTCGISVNEDGKMGPVTYMAVNKCDENTLVQALIDKSKAFYLRIVEKKPSQKKFLNNWLSRASKGL